MKPREAFEKWMRTNRPQVPLFFSDLGQYDHPGLQAEWLAFAAGWALRGQNP